MENPTIRRRLASIRQRVNIGMPLEAPDARLLLELVECGLLALAQDPDSRVSESPTPPAQL